MRPKIRDLMQWLASLAEDRYPEDRLCEGDADAELQGILFCWMANAGARQMALERGLNVIVTHEAPYYESRQVDPGCPPPSEWKVNMEIRQFYSSSKVACIRCHRTLDACCIPRVFGERLGFPPPVIHEGHKGYEFTLVYDLPARRFGELARELKERMGLPFVRTSSGDAKQVVSRVGMGWGGVSLSANLQYMERLRGHGVQVVIGGEVDEYAIEYFRESGMEWIELGHYASEIIGLERVASDAGVRFPAVPAICYRDSCRMRSIF
jgi:putative NIF3 family GTP cyclohydrolase 1 type 2